MRTAPGRRPLDDQSPVDRRADDHVDGLADGDADDHAHDHTDDHADDPARELPGGGTRAGGALADRPRAGGPPSEGARAVGAMTREVAVAHEALTHDPVPHDTPTHDALTHDAVPHDTVAPAAAGGEYLEVPWSVLDDYRCFGCSPHNPYGMRLRFRAHPEGLVTTFRLGREHESYPGVIHGGLLGVICDETMGNLIVLRVGATALTTGMRLRYLAPVSVDTAYDCVARLRPTPSAHGLLHAEADILDGAGSSVATASATFQPVPFDVARSRFALGADEAERLRDALVTTTPTPPTEEP
jgi:acyl-coenzyme A thioesterase PaaI-like protein